MGVREKPVIRRGGDEWVVSRLNVPEVEKINHQLRNSLTDMGVSRMARPDISEKIILLNVVRKRCYVVLIHRVNSHSIGPKGVGNLIKLSERRFAPYHTETLRLATPAHYRKNEKSNPTIGDPHDGYLTKNATPWVQNTLTEKFGEIKILDATVTFSAPDEPWIYCTSIAPNSNREIGTLRAAFLQYDAVTEITSPESFAIQLGIDFAISVEKSRDVTLSPIDEWAYRQSKYTVSLWEGECHIDKYVRVYHGPVCYEDQSGVLKSLEDFSDLSGVPLTWFTKKSKFAGQREYRFAVSTLGSPRKDKFYLDMSEELRKLTVKA